jgi:hypothetical protein
MLDLHGLELNVKMVVVVGQGTHSGDPDVIEENEQRV